MINSIHQSTLNMAFTQSMKKRREKMDCGTCKHWSKRHHFIQEFGICKLLSNGNSAGIGCYYNRDGELVETIVETLPDFFCAEYDEKEKINGNN